jgi:superoxide dismutase
LGFSVTSNSVLRNTYGVYRDLTKSAARSETTANKLSIADSTALKKVITGLQHSLYDDKEDATDSEGYAKSYAKRMKAFIDTYNYTLESSKKNSSSDISRQVPKMKKLAEKYKDELNSAGITYDSDGYLKVSSSIDTSVTKRFEKIFGEDSDFMNDLKDIAGNIKRHVNVYL